MYKQLLNSLVSSIDEMINFARKNFFLNRFINIIFEVSLHEF